MVGAYNTLGSGSHFSVPGEPGVPGPAKASRLGPEGLRPGDCRHGQADARQYGGRYAIDDGLDGAHPRGPRRFG